MHERCWFIDLQPDIAHKNIAFFPAMEFGANITLIIIVWTCSVSKELNWMPRIWYDNNNNNVNKTPENGEQRKPYVYAFFFQLLQILHILSNRTPWANLSLLCLAIRYWQPTEAIEQKNHIFIPTGFEWARMIRHIFYHIICQQRQTQNLQTRIYRTLFNL